MGSSDIRLYMRLQDGRAAEWRTEPPPGLRARTAPIATEAYLLDLLAIALPHLPHGGSPVRHLLAARRLPVADPPAAVLDAVFLDELSRTTFVTLSAAPAAAPAGEILQAWREACDGVQESVRRHWWSFSPNALSVARVCAAFREMHAADTKERWTRWPALDLVKDSSPFSPVSEGLFWEWAGRVFDLEQSADFGAGGMARHVLALNQPIPSGWDHGAWPPGLAAVSLLPHCRGDEEWLEVHAVRGLEPEPPALACSMASATDVGRRRTRNEDDHAAHSERGWAVVSDGMGGHADGDEASRLAVAAFGEAWNSDPHPDPAMHMRQSVHAAADAVWEGNCRLGRGGPEYDDMNIHHRMGCTLTAAALKDGRLHIGHGGDSRLYWRRPSRASGVALPCRQITLDHTDRGHLHRALGPYPKFTADALSLPASPGDLVLLCTDGLTDALGKSCVPVLSEILDRGGATLQQRADALVEAANRKGGPDNITVCLIRIDAA